MKFFRWAVLQNSWLWFHMLAGGILAKFLMIWLPGGTIFAIILFSAVAWEVLEYIFSDVEKIMAPGSGFSPMQ